MQSETIAQLVEYREHAKAWTAIKCYLEVLKEVLFTSKFGFEHADKECHYLKAMKQLPNMTTRTEMKNNFQIASDEIFSKYNHITRS
jgi:hypothetical protein